MVLISYNKRHALTVVMKSIHEGKPSLPITDSNTVNEHFNSGCMSLRDAPYKERKFMAFTILTTKSATAKP